jgi:hypothetical protein
MHMHMLIAIVISFLVRAGIGVFTGYISAIPMKREDVG